MLKKRDKRSIFLIDGSSFLYRAYYGMRPLHTSDGRPVHAVYSFCRMIKKLIDTYEPHYAVLVWDSKGKTERHKIFSEYKATRQAAPSDLGEQKEAIIEFASMIGLKQVIKHGVEADDLMFSIAQDVQKEGIRPIYVSTDKDMVQALVDGALMYDAFKQESFDAEKMEEKFGFPVAKVPFYFALLGDASDNIPGVRGIGKKGATTLVQKYDSLEQLYTKIDTVTPERTRKLLLESKDNALLSLELFTLRYHPVSGPLKTYEFDPRRWSEAVEFFKQYDFKSLVKAIDSAMLPKKEVSLAKHYSFILVTSAEHLQQLCANIQQAGHCAIDTETEGLDAHTAPLVGISCAYDAKSAYYIPVGHTQGQQLSLQEIVAVLGPVLGDMRIKKYLHNAKFDAHVLSQHGMALKGLTFDTMVAARLVVKDWQRIGLKYLSERFFQESMFTYADMVTSKKRKNFSEVPIDEALEYAAADALQTFRLQLVLEQELKQAELWELFCKIEMPLVGVLFAMERRGVVVDTALLNRLDDKVTKDLDTINSEIRTFLSEDQLDINLNSPRQLEHLLFTVLQLPPQKKSAKRTGYSTDQEVLVELAKQHPVPALIVKHRELSKLQNTYLKALPTYVNPKTHRIHTSFSQTKVATGRLASSDPNLQNIPVDCGYTPGVRAAFVPEPGHVFVSADYSQIELRVLAHLSQDQFLVRAFLENHDIHAQTASGLFDVPLEHVTGKQRQIGKRINFSILYGLTPYGLSKDLGISYKEAKKYIDRYFEQYPQVSTWMESVIEATKKYGYTTTLGGRRRDVPGIYEKNQTLFDLARRIAINTYAQGTAAEIMKMGMICLYKKLKSVSPRSYLLLQIHDEVLISAPDADADLVAQESKEVLESVVSWNVPLVVTTRIGAHWEAVTK